MHESARGHDGVLSGMFCNGRPKQRIKRKAESLQHEKGHQGGAREQQRVLAGFFLNDVNHVVDGDLAD